MNEDQNQCISAPEGFVGDGREVWEGMLAQLDPHLRQRVTESFRDCIAKVATFESVFRSSKPCQIRFFKAFVEAVRDNGELPLPSQGTYERPSHVSQSTVEQTRKCSKRSQEISLGTENPQKRMNVGESHKCSSVSNCIQSKVDLTHLWTRDIKLPPPSTMCHILKLTNVIPFDVDRSASWTRRLFKRNFHPDSFTQKNGNWIFNSEVTRSCKEGLRRGKKDLKTIADCAEVFQKYGLDKLGKAVTSGASIVEARTNSYSTIIDAQRMLERPDLLYAVMTCIYQILRKPLRFDAVVGGRDLGGVYTELMLSSAWALSKKLESLNIIKPGTLVLEVGSGLFTMGIHFALVHQCPVIGVEIEPERAMLGLKSLELMRNIWDDPKIVELRQKQYFQPVNYPGFEDYDAYMRKNIDDVRERIKALPYLTRMLLMDGTKVPLQNVGFEYLFDEAYNDPECEIFYDRWAESDIPYLGAYKLNKRPHLLLSLQERHKNVYVVATIAAHKIAKGGQSTCVILGKKPSPDAPLFLDRSNIGFNPNPNAMITPSESAIIAPITSCGWMNPNWIEDYARTVVTPKCNGYSVLVETPDTNTCMSSFLIKCDPLKANDSCNCKEVFRPLEDHATEKMQSAIHGVGLIANTAIASGRLILFYTGTRSQRKPEDCTYTTERNGIYITADSIDKHAAINHSCNPNCCLKVIMRSDKSRDRFDVCLTALNDIQPGDELTVDYRGETRCNFGKSKCRCGSPACRYERNRLLLFFNLMDMSGAIGMGSTDICDTIISRVKGGNMEVQDGRDQYRVELLKKATGANVYAISTDTTSKTGLDPNFHMDCNVSIPAKLERVLANINARFERIYLDWVWTPLPWWKEHISLQFFQQSLPMLVRKGFILPGGLIFLPFNPYTFSCITCATQSRLAMKDTLAFNFQQEVVTETQLGDHELWNVTQSCDHKEFQAVLGKGIPSSTQHYLSFSTNAFKQLSLSEKAEALLKALDSKFGVENIRFIKLVAARGGRGKTLYETYMS